MVKNPRGAKNHNFENSIFHQTQSRLCFKKCHFLAKSHFFIRIDSRAWSKPPAAKNPPKNAMLQKCQFFGQIWYFCIKIIKHGGKHRGAKNPPENAMLQKCHFSYKLIQEHGRKPPGRKKSAQKMLYSKKSVFGQIC